MKDKMYFAVLVMCAIGIGFTPNAFSQRTDQQVTSTSKKDNLIDSRLDKLQDRIATLENKIEKILTLIQQSNADNQGLVPFDEVVLNLAHSKLGGERYLKMSIVFEVEKESTITAKNAVNKFKARLMDSLISIVSEKQYQEILGKENLKALRTEIRKEFNTCFNELGQPKYIKSVLFKELQVQ